MTSIAEEPRAGAIGHNNKRIVRNFVCHSSLSFFFHLQYRSWMTGSTSLSEIADPVLGPNVANACSDGGPTLRNVLQYFMVNRRSPY
jgi:hypothetical protein